AALWNTPSRGDKLLGQLDRLISFAELPSLEFGVMPREVLMPIAPLACFAVYDDEFVLIETLTGEQRLDDPDEVAVYLKAFDQLRDTTTGLELVALIRRIMADLGR
ncbi:MAG: Scr1 family TA system antitoxin-like transcriptional regulator, partial [Pseudonocardiaceae bacterium]